MTSKVKLKDSTSQYLMPQGPQGSIFRLKCQVHRNLAVGSQAHMWTSHRDLAIGLQALTPPSSQGSGHRSSGI